jgi:hypothetical protein
VVGNRACKSVAALPNSPIEAKAMAAVLRTLGFEARLAPGFLLCAEYERQLGGGSPLSSLMAAKD